MADQPLIVQSDKTVLLDVDHPRASEARSHLAPFAELERAPEHIHTYRITPLALWNARAAGKDAEQLVDVLETYSRFPIPAALLIDLTDTMSRYGRVSLSMSPAHGLILHSDEQPIMEELRRHKRIIPLLGTPIDAHTNAIAPSERGRLKQELIKVGWPAADTAGYVNGQAHSIELAGAGWQLRDYQTAAVESFLTGGSGVVVLPCGAGKTIVGAATMAELKTTTLILVTNTVAGRQWRDELLARTTLTASDIGEYSGEKKEIRPVTIATYQVVTRKTKGEYRALELFDSRDWGLIIYDEVHLLPAPVFRMTSDLQSRRRLGLTATLVREDGREDDVFTLIGPKRYDAPWKDLEASGHIATADCVEVRTGLTESERLAYATAESADRYRLAACAGSKLRVVGRLLARHAGEPALIIGAYIDQLGEIAETISAPLIDGKTSTTRREKLFNQFRSGEVTTLVVSKVANFSIDLPEAAVAIQVSGTFGSRQEEAQRLGRLLRPKQSGAEATFYTIVSRDTIDADYAAHRQRFLAEQGYGYRIIDAADIE
ncbi:MAG: DNA repair helicase XPB [Corynebacterium sp.]|nr:DNA repair helicase XPB [Corynebacterium sp.]